MTGPTHEILLVVAQTFALYVFLVVALGRLGRPILAGLTPLQLLVIALLGSAVETALYRASGSMAAGLASATTLILANQALTYLVNRWPKLRCHLVGQPVLLVADGRIIDSALRRVHLSHADLEAALRHKGLEDVASVHYAVLEMNGDIGIVERAPGPR